MGQSVYAPQMRKWLAGGWCVNTYPEPFKGLGTRLMHCAPARTCTCTAAGTLSRIPIEVSLCLCIDIELYLELSLYHSRFQIGTFGKDLLNAHAHAGYLRPVPTICVLLPMPCFFCCNSALITRIQFIWI